jgi:hypothetical protein
VPELVAHLAEWIHELHGRSGAGMHGLSPLSYSTIAEWSRLKHIPIESDEVDVLLMLDGILMHPDRGQPKQAETSRVSAADAAWPTKKVDVEGADA